MLPQCEFLLERLNLARQHLDELVAKSPKDKFIYPNWTIKEYMDHLSGWDDAVVSTLRAHGSGEPVPMTVKRGINFYNSETITNRKTIDLDHSKLEYQASRQAALQALRELPDEKFNQPLIFPWGEDGTVAYFIEIFVEHDEHHADHLSRWLEQPDRVLTDP
jgi:hypothetical protein